MVKQLIWKLMGERGQHAYKKMQFKRTKRYKWLTNHDKDEQAYLLLDTPEHGNLGDQAIAVAVSDFIRFYFPQRKLYEFTYGDCKDCIEEIQCYTSEDKNIIVIPGGGFIGTLWMNEHENVIRILKVFKKYKIVIFPQTIYFDNSDAGMMLAEEFQKCLMDCLDITVFVRDEKSYEWLKQGFAKCQNVKYALVPDIVTALQHGIKDVGRKKKVLVCMRNDLEKTSDEDFLGYVVPWLTTHGYSITRTDTVINHVIGAENRKKYVVCKLKQFASSSLVITDRLHGMIFAAITATPCISMDNVSGKVHGGYKWLEGLDYITYINGSKITEKLVEKMLSISETQYDYQYIWAGYLDEIIEALRF